MLEEAMKKPTYTIAQFNAMFPNEDACLDFIFQARWPDGVFCEKCQRVAKHYRITGRKVYSCEFCGTHVSPLADTIFHKSDTPLCSWLHAMFLMSSTRCGISAKQLQRELGVTYKTAWRMFHQIRSLMDDNPGPLSGQVEADETYVGGKPRAHTATAPRNKTAVFGMVQRKAKVIAKVVPDAKASTLHPLIAKHIPAADGTTVYTDEFASYDGLKRMGYTHQTIQHVAKVYVSGSAHTQTIDGFWSLVKRGVDGVYHSVSRQHLQSYLDEYAFRYNHRDDALPMFPVLLAQIPRHLSS